MKYILTTVVLFFVMSFAAFAETLPAFPEHHFNDYAGLVSSQKANELDAKLIELEKASSTQFVVAVYPTLDTDSSLEDYTQRLAESWGVGTKDHSNGVVLFVFVKASDGHTKIRLEVGYGLEGALPDATAKNIIENQIIPHFKAAKAGAGQVEWEKGLTAGVNATTAAIHGEYKVVSAGDTNTGLTGLQLIGIIFICLIALLLLCAFLGAVSGGGGYSSGGSYSSGDSDGGSWGSSGSSGSSGGFSGGGGSFGGGGASGDC